MTTPRAPKSSSLVSTSLTFLGALLFLGLSALPASGQTYISDFGQGGWYSWDTRNTSGTALNGSADTSPSITSTLLGRSVGSASPADDSAIGAQIVFMDEGQTVNDVGDAAGNPPPASPLGSLGGRGYVRLDGTSSNSGKSDFSYVNTSGIAAASALTDPGFNLSYRYNIVPQPTFRTLGLNIALTNNAQSNLYIFASVDPAAVTGWNTSSVSANTGLFTLFANGSSALAGSSMTLTQWAADPTFGPQIFGGSENVFRVGFNVGSGQRDNLQYLDWVQTDLLNGGNVIDFVGPSAVPEPGTWLVGSLAVIGALVISRRRLSKRTPVLP